VRWNPSLNILITATAFAVFFSAALLIGCSVGGPSTEDRAPFGQVLLSQNSFDLAGCGGPTSATFTASQANYPGNFSAVSADTRLVQVTLASAPGTFLLQQEGAGVPPPATTITVTGGGGLQATATVTTGFHICG